MVFGASSDGLLENRGDSWCDSLEDCACDKQLPIRMRCYQEEMPNGNIVYKRHVRCVEIQRMKRFFTDFFTDKWLCKWYENSYKRFAFKAFQSALYDKIKQDRRDWERALKERASLW